MKSPSDSVSHQASDDDRAARHKGGSFPTPLLELVLVLLGLLSVSLAVRLTGLDLTASRWFYSPLDGWRLNDHSLVQLLYQYGTWPAFIVTGLLLVSSLLAWWFPALRRYWNTTGYLILLLVIGPGLVVNAGFKDHFGRPRPREIVEFGGDQTFLPVGTPGTSGEGKSFPSGHAAMGFFWLGLYLLYRRRCRRLALAWLLIGLSHGALMSFGRVVQGGHFVSDVLWSAGFVYLTAWALLFVLPPEGRVPRGRR